MKSLIGAAAMALAGCTVGPNYEEPKLNDVPDKFSAGAATTQRATTRPAALSTMSPWWTLFGDPGLDQVIAQARESNLDLREAEARVRESRALRGVSSGRYWPDIAGGADYSRSRSSDNVIEGGEFDTTDRDLWTAGFDAVWELDVFGGIRRSVEAADRDIEAAVADRNDVLLSLLAETARNYVELRVAQRQVAIAEENVNAQKQTLELTRARLNAGLTSDLDVARSEAQVAATASRIPTLQSQVQQSIHRLSVLTGRPPKGLAEQLGRPTAVPAPPPEIPTGLPSELLRRRPDIRRVERNLAAQTARVGVAVADLYPKFTLTGSLGLQSNEFKTWGNSDSLFWSIGPGVRLPIFNAGRLRSQVAAERARTDQVLAAYERTVLNSLAEVEDALVAYQKEYARRDALAQAVSANQRAVQLSQQLYQRGLTDFLNVLDAQRALYLAEDELAQSDATVSSNAISLFKALGGGWEAEQVAVK